MYLLTDWISLFWLWGVGVSYTYNINSHLRCWEVLHMNCICHILRRESGYCRSFDCISDLITFPNMVALTTVAEKCKQSITVIRENEISVQFSIPWNSRIITPADWEYWLVKASFLQNVTYQVHLCFQTWTSVCWSRTCVRTVAVSTQTAPFGVSVYPGTSWIPPVELVSVV